MFDCIRRIYKNKIPLPGLFKSNFKVAREKLYIF